MDSILTSIKKLLGITEEYDQFDTDIIMHINTAFATLNQIGAGPDEGFVIYDKYKTWDEYFQNDNNLEMIKTYIFLKVKLLFDPPQSSSVTEVINRQISELEWRISVHVDPKKEETNE